MLENISFLILVKKHLVEVLEEAAPVKPRELSQEECKALIESEETTLRELRLFLRSVTWKLLADRKFKEFTKPVDLDEVRLLSIKKVV